MCVLQGKTFSFDFISLNFPCLICWKIINFPFSTISSESVQLKIGIYHHSFLNSIRFAAVLFQPKIESLQKWFCFSFTLVDQKKSLLDKRIECKWSEKSLLEANNDVACSEYFMRLEKVHSPHYNTEHCNEKKRNMNNSLYSRLMGQNLSIRFFLVWIDWAKV